MSYEPRRNLFCLRASLSVYLINFLVRLRTRSEEFRFLKSPKDNNQLFMYLQSKRYKGRPFDFLGSGGCVSGGGGGWNILGENLALDIQEKNKIGSKGN